MGRPRKQRDDDKGGVIKMTRAKGNMKQLMLLTHPNGYSLQIEGHRNTYFYKSLAELIEGFLFRVAMEDSRDMDLDKIHELIVAATTYKEKPELVKNTIQLQTKIRGMQGTINALRRKIESLECNE